LLPSVYETWLCMPLSADDLSFIEQRLDDLLTEWIRLWRQYHRSGTQAAASTVDAEDKK